MNNIPHLLDNQTIRIDNHHLNSVHDWNDPKQDIHIHKQSSLRQDDNWYELRIPLHGELPDFDLGIPKRIKKEIHKVFKEEKNRKSFVKSIYKELVTNWNWIIEENQEIEEERVRRLSNRIVQALGFCAIPPIATKSCYLQLMKKAGKIYHLTFNSHKQVVYLGEFTPGLTTPISKELRRKWAKLVADSLKLIIESPNKYKIIKTLRDRLRYNGRRTIGMRTIKHTEEDITFFLES